MKNIITKFQMKCKGFNMLVSSNDKWVCFCIGCLMLAIGAAVIIYASAELVRAFHV